MLQLLRWTTKNLVIAIPAAMAAGLAYGAAFDAAPLKAGIIPLTFMMVFPMMVTLRVREVLAGGDLFTQTLTQVLNFGVIPFAALALGYSFFPHSPAMMLGLLLAALVPTSGMTISWTGLAKGNVAAAVRMTVFGLVLGALATPLYVSWLLGAAISMDLAMVLRQILLVVFLPMLLGQAARRWLLGRMGKEAFALRIGPNMPVFSTIGVLGVVFTAMALKAPAILQHPSVLAGILWPLVLLYGGNFLVASVVGRLFLPRGDAIALVYGTVMRNLSIALAMAMSAFGAAGAEAALVIAMAYVVQVQSAAWFVRFTDKVFGVEPELAKIAEAADTEDAAEAA